MMKKDNPQNDWLTSGSAGVKETTYSQNNLTFFDRVQAISLLHLIAGVAQVFLGVTVIFLSVMGFIQPLWLSTFVGIVASATTMIGLYLVFLTLAEVYSCKDLVRNAMQRVIEARN